MKCSRCSRGAIIFLKHPKLRFCQDHFNEYFIRKVQRTIRKYRMINPSDKIAVAVSGGKDSIALLHVLTRIISNSQITCIHINLGISGYSENCQIVVEEVCELLGVKYEIVDLEREYGFTIDYLVKRGIGKRAPCSICGLVKRRVVNDMALKLGFEKLATGHTLDDEVTFLLQNLASGNLDLIIRSGPVAESKYGKLVGKIKPLYEISEQETMLYCYVNKLKYVDVECPYARNAPSLKLKKLINEIESIRPGFKISLLKNFTRKIKPIITEKLGTELGEQVKFCRLCGYPTVGDVCAFCRLKMKLEKYAN